MPNIFNIYNIYKFGGPKFINVITIINIYISYNIYNSYNIFNIYNLIATGSRKCKIILILTVFINLEARNL